MFYAKKLAELRSYFLLQHDFARNQQQNYRGNAQSQVFGVSLLILQNFAHVVREFLFILVGVREIFASASNVYFL